ncbi:MAG: extracellular solute-binding protein, partial [Anaerolineae bacterium]|nr:extracellular solute-binding protein [Anaerolineae bacterium]
MLFASLLLACSSTPEPAEDTTQEEAAAEEPAEAAEPAAEEAAAEPAEAEEPAAEEAAAEEPAAEEAMTDEEAMAGDDWWAEAAAPYQGVTIRGISESTPPSKYVSEVLAPQFEELTGIKVEFEATSWDQMYSKAIQDMEANTGIYDFVYI